MTKLIALPDHDRPLPTPADLDRLMQCRYVVLVVAGRSGSGLLHAHLDGHHQIAQIPAIWKFHDFLSARHGLLAGSISDLARSFTGFPAHEFLFDTRRSTALAGQLGEDGAVAILVDRTAFADAMVSALGQMVGDPRRVLFAAVLAYEWCLGRDLRQARVVLHHLHHGDWLRPDLLLETYNLSGHTPPPELRAALRPDLLLVSLRDPLQIVQTYPALAAAVLPDGAQRVVYYEQLLRLLVQDWLRARAIAGSGTPTFGVQLEDMKADLPGTLSCLCAEIGVDAGDPALGAITYYGHSWTEDSWSPKRKKLVMAHPELDAEVCWQDKSFVMGALAGLTAPIYPVNSCDADWNAVLGEMMRSTEDPPFTLYPELKASAAGRRTAADRVWERIAFLERFRALTDAQQLGALRLCRTTVRGDNRLSA